MPFEQRWQRFDQAVWQLRVLLGPETALDAGARDGVPVARLPPPPQPRRGVPLWIGSWGSAAGLRRVARLGDGWLASAYNTTPEAFVAARELLGAELGRKGRSAGDFPHALVTMWAWITDERSAAERVLSRILAPLVNRDPAQLRGGCVSARPRNARSCCPAMPGQAASASISGRWATSRASSSSSPGK